MSGLETGNRGSAQSADVRAVILTETYLLDFSSQHIGPNWLLLVFYCSPVVHHIMELAELEYDTILVLRVTGTEL